MGIRFQTPLEGLYSTPFYDIGYSWYENKEYQSENHYLMDAMGIQILYTRSANFYVKWMLQELFIGLNTMENIEQEFMQA